MKRGELVAGRFEVQALAGTGAMGVVWRAIDRASGTLVALKILRPGAESERFLRESRLLAELDHPGIVKYVAHGSSDEGPFLVMEWLEGESLAERIERAELGVSESVAVVRRIAEAMGAAHRRQIVHRDLKPSNVFLVGRSLDDVRVLDFGIARQGAGGDLTQTGMIVGSPRYMAPEQARGGKEVGPAADVWALGAILYRCLTGRPLLPDGPVEVILSDLLLAPVPRASDVRKDLPQELDDLLAELLTKDPLGRPRNGDEVARRLAALSLPDDLEPPPSRGKSETGALTLAEQRFTCVVLVTGLEAALEHSAPLDLGALGAEHGATLERHAERLALVFRTFGTASDVVAQAARAALAIERRAPGVRLSLATGTGPVHDLAHPDRSVVARAEALVERTAGGIYLDTASAGLLESRFVLERGAGSEPVLLRAERVDSMPVRRLLGRTTPCVGRERELAVLESLLGETLSESVARVAVVTGEAGVGKSRLRYELISRVQEIARGSGTAAPAVWLGRTDAVADGSPLALLGSALRAGLGVSLDTPELEIEARIASHAARAHDPEASRRIATALTEMLMPPASPNAVAHDPVLAGDRLRAAFEDFVAGELEAHPVVLVLEDLHWGDWGSVRFVDAALRLLHDRPFFVLALGRPDLSDRFPGLWAERRPLSLPLGELGRRASEALVRSVLGSDVSEDTARALVDRAGGNAFFLEELIRAVAEGARGSELPGSVLAVAEARLSALDPDLRQTLRASSVFGQVFWPEGVAALLKKSVPVVSGVLARLCDKELVSRRKSSRFGSRDEYVFRHAFVRETAYGMLTDADRTLGHRLAADWLERAGEREPLLLAEHWHLGGDSGRAAPLYRRAAEQAMFGNDFARAIEHAERGLAAGADGELRGELELLKSQAHQWRGEAVEREAAARRAMELFPRLSPRWYAAAAETARIASRAGRHAEMAELFAEVEGDAAARTAGARAVVLAQLCVPALRAGHQELAERMLAALARAGDVLGPADHEGRGWIARAEGYGALVSGDAATYLRKTEEAVRAFDAAQDERHAVTFQTSVGFAHIALGLYARAAEILTDALARAERMNLALTCAIAKHNLGYALGLAGELQRGIAVEAEAVAEAERQNDRWIECVSQTYLAALLLRGGDFARARAAAERGAELSDRPNRVVALALRARADLGLGEPLRALEAARESHQLLDELGSIEDGDGLARLLQVEVERAAGDAATANQWLSAARERLETRARAISDPELRASFLECVPEHRDTLALAKALG